MRHSSTVEIDHAQEIARSVARKRLAGRAWEGIDVDDVVQEVLLRFALLDLDEVDNWQAWVVTTTKNRCADVTAAAQRHRNEPIHPDADEPGGQPDVAARVGAWVVGPSAAAMHPQMLAYVMESLSDRERRVVLRHLDGWTNTEIAEAFGYANAQSVGSTLSRAKKKIRDRFADTTQIEELLTPQRPYVMSPRGGQGGRRGGGE